MKSSRPLWIVPRLFSVGLALLLGASASGARADIIFSEDFSGATPGGGYVNAITGTQFRGTGGNVDIIGVLNGHFFESVANPNGNALDLVGDVGQGRIASVPTFDLAAGTTYTIGFQYILQGFNPTDTATSDFTVGLGGFSQRLTAIPSVVSASLTYTPTAAEAGVTLTFATNTAPDSFHGPVLSSIVVTRDAPAAVPEPSSLLLTGGGLGLLCLARRRSRTSAG